MKTSFSVRLILSKFRLFVSRRIMLSIKELLPNKDKASSEGEWCVIYPHLCGCEWKMAFSF